MSNTVGYVSNNPASPVYNANMPNLTGQVGSLLAVLDAALVNGVTGFTALGWSKPFANSGNLGCYKNSTTSPIPGTGYCLAVNDNGPGAGAAKEARITGFTSMSSVSAGSGQFPTGAQSSIGTGQLAVRKSTTADGTTRYYTIGGDPTCFYMFIETGDFTGPTGAYVWMFGDFFSYSSSDVNNCAIRGRAIENSTSCCSGSTTSPSAAGTYDTFGINFIPNLTNPLAQTMTGFYVAANYNGVGGSLPAGHHIDCFKSNIGQPTSGSNYWCFFGQCGVTGNAGSFPAPGNFNYPNGPDGGLYTSPVWIHHQGNLRGYFKGLWCPLQSMPLNHNDTYSGTGNMSGKSLLCQEIVNAVNASSATAGVGGQMHLETSSTWG